MRNFLALALVTISVFTSRPVKADDWGCTVLLCLASPSDPMQIAACVSPLKRLWKALTKWNPDPFPNCDMASGSNGRSYGQLSTAYYDACPSGTTALAYGGFGLQGTAADAAASTAAQTRFTTANPFANATALAGIGEQGAEVPPDAMNFAQPGAKVCVGQAVGKLAIPQQTSNDGMFIGTTLLPVTVYDRVVILDRYASPRQVNIFVNDQLAKTVRY
jgi:hypothetical protein